MRRLFFPALIALVATLFMSLPAVLADTHCITSDSNDPTQRYRLTDHTTCYQGEDAVSRRGMRGANVYEFLYEAEGEASVQGAGELSLSRGGTGESRIQNHGFLQPLTATFRIDGLVPGVLGVQVQVRDANGTQTYRAQQNTRRGTLELEVPVDGFVGARMTVGYRNARVQPATYNWQVELELGESQE